MGRELGWDEAYSKCQVERYRALVADQYPHLGLDEAAL
jgi:hypothetical protein